MLTRKKRIGIDSSPKSAISKNAQLLTKETMQNTVNMLSTPPSRRNPFMLSNNYASNMMNDDSPVLSQESINISWKWNNESTPIRPHNKSSKLRRSITNNASPQFPNLQRLKRNSNDNNSVATATTTTVAGSASPKLAADSETHSPKGLYKFQEEMRKIQFDTELDTSSCDNINDKSVTASDTGCYPHISEKTATAVHDTNRMCEKRFDVHTIKESDEPVKALSQNVQHGIDDNLADDLFNDSDFDQILLTCKMPAEKEACETKTNEKNREQQQQLQSSVKSNTAPEIKMNGTDSNSSGSNWNLMDDDCFDDLVKDFDVDIPCTQDTSAKFTRHKSMPQQTKKPSTSTNKTFNSQQGKSFIRHGTMPITSLPPNKNTVSGNRNSEFSSTQNRKCTTEEIAEKRRQAIERLKNRKKTKANT